VTRVTTAHLFTEHVKPRHIPFVLRPVFRSNPSFAWRGGPPQALASSSISLHRLSRRLSCPWNLEGIHAQFLGTPPQILLHPLSKFIESGPLASPIKALVQIRHTAFSNSVASASPQTWQTLPFGDFIAHLSIPFCSYRSSTCSLQFHVMPNSYPRVIYLELC